MKRKILSMILTLGMIISLIPTITTKATNTINIGDYVQMGSYYDEPILWRCVDIDENGPLMLAHKIITIKPYDAAGNHKYLDGTAQADPYGYRTSYGSNLWETSNMRSWLNSNATAGNVTWLDGCPPTADKLWSGYNAYATEKGFMADGNFTASERNAIKSVTQKSLLSYLDVSKLSTSGTATHTWDYYISTVVQNYDTAYSNNITDKMFLLDVKQINKVYQNSATLGTNYYIGKPTQKAVDNSEYKDSNNLTTANYWYNWLRSPDAGDYYGNDVRYVHSGGFVNNSGAYDSVLGARPAFYINLTSVILKSGNGSVGEPYVVGFEGELIDISTASVSGTSGSGLTVNVPVNVNNFTNQNLQGKLTVALYDNVKNKLINIKNQDLSLDANQSTTITETFTASAGKYKVKAFWWDGFSNIIPLCKVAEKPLDTSNNAHLSSLKIDGKDVAGFSQIITDYDVIAFGDTPPIVTATSENSNATINIEQAATVNSNAVVTVMAQDGTIKIYTIHFANDISNPSIVLNVGQIFSIIKKERGNYLNYWHYNIVNINIINLNSESNIADNPNVLGGSSTHTWNFIGLKPGIAKITISNELETIEYFIKVVDNE